jgi:hypothetical protein
LLALFAWWVRKPSMPLSPTTTPRTGEPSGS